MKSERHLSWFNDDKEPIMSDNIVLESDEVTRVLERFFAVNPLVPEECVPWNEMPYLPTT